MVDFYNTIILRGNKFTKGIVQNTTGSKVINGLSNGEVDSLLGKYFKYPDYFYNITVDYYSGGRVISDYTEDGIIVIYGAEIYDNLEMEKLSKDYFLILAEGETISRLPLEVALGITSADRIAPGKPREKALEIREKIFRALALRKSLELRLEKGGRNV